LIFYSNQAIAYIPLKILEDNSLLLLTSVLCFFLFKNYVSIRINNYQAKTAYNLSSEYSVSLSKFYLLGNYLTFKKQKKSSIIKEIIFVTNDFVINVVLSVNAFLAEFTLLIIIMSIGFYFFINISIFILFLLVSIFLFLKFFNQKAIDTINRNRSIDHDENISNLTNLLNGYMSIKSPDLLHHLHSKKINTSKQTEIIIVLLICAVFAYVNLFPSENFNAAVFLSIFGTLLFKAIPSLNKLNIALTNINSNKYSLDILEEKLNQISKIDKSKNHLTFNKKIVLKDVFFSYDAKKPILKNLNLTIKKGDFIAIDGKSGVGKTTLLNILSKLIDANSGEIILDDIKITDFNKYNYFNLITYLTQNPFIYEGSVLDNLVLDKTVVPREEIDFILKELNILEIVDLLPEGIHNYIGVQGSNLSGGQLQRLCIARALLHKPQILILDEATNNLDNTTETKVLEFLKTYSKKHNITVISVSHYLDKNTSLYDSVLDLNAST